MTVTIGLATEPEQTFWGKALYARGVSSIHDAAFWRRLLSCAGLCCCCDLRVGLVVLVS